MRPRSKVNASTFFVSPGLMQHIQTSGRVRLYTYTITWADGQFLPYSHLLCHMLKTWHIHRYIYSIDLSAMSSRISLRLRSQTEAAEAGSHTEHIFLRQPRFSCVRWPALIMWPGYWANRPFSRKSQRWELPLIRTILMWRNQVPLQVSYSPLLLCYALLASWLIMVSLQLWVARVKHFMANLSSKAAQSALLDLWAGRLYEFLPRLLCLLRLPCRKQRLQGIDQSRSSRPSWCSSCLLRGVLFTEKSWEAGEMKQRLCTNRSTRQDRQGVDGKKGHRFTREYNRWTLKVCKGTTTGQDTERCELQKTQLLAACFCWLFPSENFRNQAEDAQVSDVYSFLGSKSRLGQMCWGPPSENIWNHDVLECFGLRGW